MKKFLLFVVVVCGMSSNFSYAGDFSGLWINNTSHLFNIKQHQDLGKLHFKDLHPPAKPLSSLTKIKELASCDSLWGEINNMNGGRIQQHEEMFERWGWEFCRPKDLKRYVIEANETLNMFRIEGEMGSDSVFSPRYRIVITEKVIKFRENNYNFE